MPEPTELPEVHLTFSPTIGALAAALVKAQTTLPNAPKNHTAEVLMKSGGKYTYSYADLAGVWDAGRGPLTGAGLAVVQAPTLTQAGLTMTTLLLHSSGEWVRGDMKGFPVPDRTPQGVGTSVTYARRYTLGAMIGAVSEEDDDGGNGGRPKAKREPQRDQATGSGSRPEASGSAPTFPNFGRMKGQPLAGAPVTELEYYLGVARKTLADPSKSKFHAKESALIGAIEAELARQRGSAQAETPKTSTPFDRLAAIAKAHHIPGERVAQWLKGNGLADRAKVTDDFVLAFERFAAEWKAASTSAPTRGNLSADGDAPVDDDAPF